MKFLLLHGYLIATLLAAVIGSSPSTQILRTKDSVVVPPSRFKRSNQRSDNFLVVNHAAIKNFLPSVTESEAFDLWAKGVKLDVPLSLEETHVVANAGRVLNNTDVLAQVGGSATFSCFTGHMSDETVTWLKREDDQLLTVGQTVYVSEERLKVSQSHRTKAWELFIQDVHLTDEGQYECQLTTHPPVSYFFTLRVTQAVAVVTGPSEVHIEEGSQLALECQVHEAPSPPIYIFWYHNGTMVNYNQNLLVNTENFTSSLVVAKVTSRDAGIYTCEPQLASPVNVTVHVVTGERPAAMQHGHNSSSGAESSTAAPPALVISLLFILVAGQMLSTQSSRAGNKHGILLTHQSMNIVDFYNDQSINATYTVHSQAGTGMQRNNSHGNGKHY